MIKFNVQMDWNAYAMYDRSAKESISGYLYVRNYDPIENPIASGIDLIVYKADEWRANIVVAGRTVPLFDPPNEHPKASLHGDERQLALYPEPTGHPWDVDAALGLGRAAADVRQERGFLARI